MSVFSLPVRCKYPGCSGVLDIDLEDDATLAKCRICGCWHHRGCYRAGTGWQVFDTTEEGEAERHRAERDFGKNPP